MTRELQPADAPRISEIMKQGAPGSGVWSSASIHDEIISSHSLALRDEAGQLIAFIFLRDAVDAYEISYLATHPQARRQRVMKSLLERALSFSTAAKRPIWLEVHERNQPARRLYESTGFRPTGKRPRYYSDGAAAILYNYG